MDVLFERKLKFINTSIESEYIQVIFISMVGTIPRP